MSFRLYSLMLVAVLTVGGCKLRIGDDGESSAKKFNNSKFNCLAEVTSKVDLYLSGNMTEKQVQEFTSCFKGALKDFEYYSKGTNQGGYLPSEIAEFLNRHYLPNNKITEKFLNEIMKIKVIIMGGSSHFITHAEFKRMLECIDILKEEAIRHVPYIRLYGLHSTLRGERFTASRQTVRDAASALQATAENLSKRLITSQASYSMDSLERLIVEIRSFIKWKELRPEATDANDLRVVIATLKEVMLGTTPDAIQPSDWAPLFKTAARLYGHYVELQTLKLRPSLIQGEGLESVIEFVENVFTTLQKTLEVQPNNVITFASLERLVDALGRIDMLPLNARASSLKPVLHLLIGKTFRDPTLVGGNPVSGFTKSALTEMRKEFYVWADSQKYISQLAFRKLGSRLDQRAISVLKSQTAVEPGFTGLSDEHLEEPLSEIDLSEYFKGANVGRDNRVYHIEYIVKHVRPMFREDDARVWLVPRSQLAKFDIKLGISNLSRLNIFGCLMRLLIRGHASQDRAISMAGVTINELESFYQTMRPLGSDVKFLDPRSERVGIRAFGEGNMFTFSGNGIQVATAANSTQHLLTFTEGLELLAFIWSGGQVRNKFYTNVSKVCGIENTPDDIFNNRKIDRACFFRHFSQNQFSEASNLPYMRAYLNRLNREQLSDFYNGLNAVSTIPCEDRRYIENAEIATISTVLHYIEVLFTIYDANKNGILSGQEVMASFPRFNVFLAQKVKEMKNKEYSVAKLKGIFVFLVKNGRIPDSIGDKIDVIWKDLWYFDNDPHQYSRMAPIDRSAPSRLLRRQTATGFEYAVDANGIPRAPSLSVDRNALLKVLVMLNKTKAPSAIKACH